MSSFIREPASQLHRLKQLAAILFACIFITSVLVVYALLVRKEGTLYTIPLTTSVEESYKSHLMSSNNDLLMSLTDSARFYFRYMHLKSDIVQVVLTQMCLFTDTLLLLFSSVLLVSIYRQPMQLKSYTPLVGFFASMLTSLMYLMISSTVMPHASVIVPIGSDPLKSPVQPSYSSVTWLIFFDKQFQISTVTTMTLFFLSSLRLHVTATTQQVLIVIFMIGYTSLLLQLGLVYFHSIFSSFFIAVSIRHVF